jgi:hypothetical protein
MRKTLDSGLEVEALGRCTDSFCSETATLAVTLKPSPHDPGRTHPTYGLCAEHVEKKYLSAEEYAEAQAVNGNVLANFTYERARYVIRPLTIREAAEVAYETDAPKRWEAEGRMGVYRRIVALHQSEEIDGVLVDATSAQLVVLVYDALKPEQQERMRGMSVVQQCEIALQLASR